MARSTTADITATGTQIVTQALYELGEYGPYDTIPPEELDDGLVVLNWLVKLWQGQPDIDTAGLKMWQRTEAELTLTAKISFSLKISGGDMNIYPPVHIIGAMLRDTDDQETPLTRMTEEEFQAIGDKTQTGTPSRFFYKRTYDDGTLFLDIIPNDTTDVLDILYLRPLYDLDLIGDDVDFPQHWYLALALNLAKFLAPRYGAKISQLTLDNAAYALAKAQQFYPEDVNVWFEPGRDD